MIPLLALGLTAFQLLPTAEYVRYSVRSEGLTFESAAGTSLNPLTSLTLLIPTFFGTVMNESCYLGQNTCIPSLYVGIFPLLLVFFAIYKRSDRYAAFFSFLAVFAFLFALGKYTVFPFYLFHKLPFFGTFRVPHVILFVYAFAMAVLAGFGFSHFTEKGFSRPPNLERLLAVVVIALALASVVVLTQENYFVEYGQGVMEARYAYYSGLPDYIPAYDIAHYQGMVGEVFSVVSHGLYTLLFLASGAYALLYARGKGLISLHRLKILVVLFVLLDLLIMAAPHIDAADPNDYFGATPEVQYLLSHEGRSEYRVLLMYGQNWTHSLAEYRTMRYGIDVAGCNDPTRIQRYDDFLASTLNKPYWSDSTYQHEVSSNQLLSLMNVKYLAVRPEIDTYSASDGYSLANRDGDLLLYENENVMPRAYLVPELEVLPASEILGRLASTDFDPKRAAVVEVSQGMTGDGVYEEAKIELYSPNRIVLSLSGENGGFLVLADSYFPGWKAMVGGKQQKVYRANYAFRGVPVERGQTRVVFEYLPTDFMRGIGITLVTIFLMACLFAFELLSKQNKIPKGKLY